MNKSLAVFLLMLISFCTNAQDTLPEFTAVKRGGYRNVISWINPYSNVTQINIQRSTDSIKNFTTILSVPDPRARQNGYVDTKAPAGVNYYRLFILFEGGQYVFTPSRRSVIDDDFFQQPIAAQKEKSIMVKKNGVIVDAILQRQVSRYRDSIVFSTRDTMQFVASDTLLIKPFFTREGPRISSSKYIYTERYGNVILNLPKAGPRKYSVVFFEDNKAPLFEIDEVKRSYLILDKANFVHSGWFWFEIYEDGELLERDRIFIPREF